MKFEDCILQLNTGLNPRSNFSLGKGNLKYITAKNLTKYGTVDFSKSDSIDEDAKRTINKRSDIQVGDILFSSRAPIGHCHLIREEPNYYDIGESIFSIRVDKKVVIPEYLCLYLTSNFFVKLASKHTTGSIIQEIRIGDLMGTKVVVPPLKIQKDIADSLYKIDRKIALNDMLNDNLAYQLKDIYNYWFNQFNFPHNDKHQYKTDGGLMIWNDKIKRKIPASWEIKSFGELCSLRNGINYDKSVEGEKMYKIINVRNISSSDLILNENDFDEISLPQKQGNKYCVSDNSIIVARSGIPGATRILQKPSGNIIFCGFIICCTPCDDIYKYYLMFYLKQLEGSAATKTGGSILQNVSQDTLSDLLVPIPPQSLLRKFNQIVSQSLELIHSNMQENTQLLKLRDWLLPMLMNGQATISD